MGKSKPQTNTELLTRGTKIYNKKRKEAEDQIEFIGFDEKKRSEYLTGFHKRNVEKKKQAIQKAKDRARAERLEIRKETREDRLRLLNEKFKVQECELSDASEEEEAKESKKLEFGDDNAVAVTTVTVEQPDVDEDLEMTPAFLLKKLKQRAKATEEQQNPPSDSDSEEDSDKRLVHSTSVKKKPKASSIKYETKTQRLKERKKLKETKQKKNQMQASKRENRKNAKKRKF